MCKTIYFVRHAEARGNVDRVFHGQFNSDITTNGHRQLEKLRELFDSIEIRGIYSSDLKRTMLTAQAVCGNKNLQIITKKELREIHGGKWEGTPWADLPRLYGESYEHWMNSPSKLVMPEGESMVDFQKRLILCIEGITKEAPEKFAVVTHGTALKALFCHFKGVTLDDFTKLKWHDNAALSVVRYENGHYTILKEGENQHLGELSTLDKQTWWKSKVG